MFGLFKKKKKELLPPVLLDINNNPIQEGDFVISKRYEMGKCKVILEGLQYFYVSEKDNKKVSYVRMIDAITGNQKVEKIDSGTAAS